jgi:hypothetical protein
MLGQLTSLLLLSSLCFSSPFFVFVFNISPILFGYLSLLSLPFFHFISFHVYVFALSPHPAVGSGCTFLGCLIQSSTELLDSPPSSLPHIASVLLPGIMYLLRTSHQPHFPYVNVYQSVISFLLVILGP